MLHPLSLLITYLTLLPTTVLPQFPQNGPIAEVNASHNLNIFKCINVHMITLPGSWPRCCGNIDAVCMQHQELAAKGLIQTDI